MRKTIFAILTLSLFISFTNTLKLPSHVVPVASWNNRIWGVDMTNRVWTKKGENGAITQIKGSLKQISVSPDGRVWGVDASSQVFTRPGLSGQWQLIEGDLNQIDAGPGGRVWGCKSGG